MENMEYVKISLVGKRGEGKYALVDGDYDGEYFAQYHWALLPNGYIARYGHREAITDEKTGLVTGWDESFIYLHREVARPPKGMWVRFKNGNKLDCRSSNLEWVTPKETAASRKSLHTEKVSV